MDQEDKFEPDSSKYQVISILGKGSAATVYKAQYQNYKTPIALKIINLETTTQSMEQIQREIKTLSTCHYKTITPLYKAFLSNQYLILVMKEMKLSIQDYLLKLCPTGLPEQYIATIMRDVLEALVYLHQNNQIHRDIKLSNLLLDDEGTTYLSDFGVSGFIDPYSQMKKNTFCGTVLTIAPEVANFQPYDQKADIWSFCICCYQLLTGSLPYETLNPMEALQSIRTLPPPKIPQNRHVSKEFRQVLEAGLQTNPAKRLSAQEILNMNFFKQASVKKQIQTMASQYILMKTQKFSDQNDQEIQEMNQILQGDDSNNKANSGWDFSYEQTEKEKPVNSLSIEQTVEQSIEPITKQSIDVDQYLSYTAQLVEEVKQLRQENQQLKQRIQQLMQNK